MRKNTPQEMLEVIQAHIDGKVIQAHIDGEDIQYEDGDDHWCPASSPQFNFQRTRYRVKLLECWMNVYPDETTCYLTREEAEKVATNLALRVAVHMKEVL
jgi:hypothetical protein